MKRSTTFTGYKKVAGAIRSIRQNLQEGQLEFSRRFQVRRNTVSRWETGQVIPSPISLIMLLRLATTADQEQGIRAGLDAAGISIDRLTFLNASIAPLTGSCNVRS